MTTRGGGTVPDARVPMLGLLSRALSFQWDSPADGSAVPPGSRPQVGQPAFLTRRHPAVLSPLDPPKGTLPAVLSPLDPPKGTVVV